MDFDNKVKMSLNDWKDFYDDDDVSISIGKVTFLSTAPNSHKHIYTESVIREFSPSYLGKFLVAEYDNLTNDVTTHTDNQTIVGYIPSNQEIVFDNDENGYFQATVDVVISKIYAPQVYKLFKDKNYRDVSVEQLVGFTPETKNFVDGVSDKIITGFEGIGITILGLSYEGSIPTTNMEIIKMSKDNIDSIEMEYVQYVHMDKDLKDDDKISVILNKLEEINNKLLENSKEEKMAKEIEKEVEEMAVDTEVKVEDETEMACGEAEKMEVVEEETETEEMACGDKEKMAELECKLSESEAKMASLEAELVELKEFKMSTLNAQKDSIVYSTLSQVKEFVDTETYSKFEESGKTCEYSDINGWKNEVLASVADKAIAKMSEITSKEDGITDMGTVGLYGKATVQKGLYD